VCCRQPVQLQAIEALKAQDRGEQQRLDRLQQRVAHRTSQERSRWSALQDRRCKCLDALKQAVAVRRAERRLPLAEIVLAARAARMTTWRRQVQCLTECQGAIRTAEQKLSATLREAGQAAIRADDLARRFGLTNAVPCAGTDLQGQCQLLCDAREASTLIPSAQAAMARLAREKASIDAELATLRSQREALCGAPMTLSRVEVECERARARVTRLAQWSAKSAEIAQARAALTEIDQELAAAASPGATDGQPVETTEERAERHQIDATRQQIANQIEQQSHQLRATLDRLHAGLGAMPAAFNVQRLTEAKSAMDQAARGAVVAESAHLDAVRDAEALAGLTLQAAAVATRQARAVGRIARVETELSNWNLFARCMSNDGLIALAIDDAGSALSGLAIARFCATLALISAPW
jgi:DNA repair protein SbcC/Rad50